MSGTPGPITSFPLYSGHPYVIVADVDAILVEDVIQAETGIRMLRASAGAVQSGETELSRFYLDSPAPGCVALIAVSTGGGQELTILSNYWRSAGMAPPPVIVEPEPSRILVKLLALVTAEVVHSARRSTDLFMQVASIRAELEETRTVLHRMQEFLGRQVGVALLATVEPYAGIVLGDPIRQLLPCGTWGLTGIDLHLASTAEGRGYFSAILYAEGNDTILGRWEVPFGSIRPGWMQLQLPRALTVWHPYPQLDITIRNLDGEPPRISVGEDGHTLAMRLWTSIPGVASASNSLPMFFVNSTSTDRFSFRVSPEELARAVSVSGPASNREVFDNGARLRLHPTPNAVVAARLSNICPQGTTDVSVMGHIDHPAGPVVEYGVFIIPHASKFRDFSSGPLLPAGGAFSGWVPVAPRLEWHQIILHLDSPSTQSCDLYLATRYGPGQHIEYAWADWQDVVIQVSCPIFAAE